MLGIPQQEQYHVLLSPGWLDSSPTATVHPQVTQLDLAITLIKLLTVEEGKGSPARMTSIYVNA